MTIDNNNTKKKHGTFCCKCKKNFSQDDIVTTHADSKGKTHYYCDICVNAIVEKERGYKINMPVQQNATSKMKKSTIVWICVIALFFIFWIIGSINNAKDTTDYSRYVICKVVPLNDGSAVPYDSSCRPCDDGTTKCTCGYWTSDCKNEGGFNVCKGHCTW